MAAERQPIRSAWQHCAPRLGMMVRAFLLAQRRRWAVLAFAAACPALLPATAEAYTAADDRIFPATVLLPQPAPTDAVYVTPSTRPVPGGDATNLTGTLDKTLIERLGVGIEDGYNWIGQIGRAHV